MACVRRPAPGERRTHMLSGRGGGGCRRGRLRSGPRDDACVDVEDVVLLVVLLVVGDVVAVVVVVRDLVLVVLMLVVLEVVRVDVAPYAGPMLTLC